MSGDYLRGYLDALGVRYNEVAARVQMDPAAFSKCLNGHREIPARRIPEIYMALGHMKARAADKSKTARRQPSGL